MANGHGGARPGAGRKSSAAKHADTVDTVETRIAKVLPDLIDRMIDSAVNRGNYAAQRYLCDRILGRTTTPAPPEEAASAEQPDGAAQPL
jgi:hypothetical protein